jgi:hypothetical protein
VAARFKVWVCGRYHVGIPCSNPAGGMCVWPLWVLSGRGPCFGLITLPEESYWVRCVCDRKALVVRRPWPTGGCYTTEKNVIYWFICGHIMYIQQLTSRISYTLFEFFFHVLSNFSSYTRLSALILWVSYMIAMAISYYRRIISTKSPATGTGNISESRLMA